MNELKINNIKNELLESNFSGLMIFFELKQKFFAPVIILPRESLYFFHSNFENLSKVILVYIWNNKKGSGPK